MLTFEGTVFDETDSTIDVLTLRASTLDNAIKRVEGILSAYEHKYWIIEIERNSK